MSDQHPPRAHTPTPPPRLPDTGGRTNFDTGARRDSSIGKGHQSSIPPDFILSVAKRFEDGVGKYDEDWKNWREVSLAEALEMLHASACLANQEFLPATPTGPTEPKDSVAPATSPSTGMRLPEPSATRTGSAQIRRGNAVLAWNDATAMVWLPMSSKSSSGSRTTNAGSADFELGALNETAGGRVLTTTTKPVKSVGFCAANATEGSVSWETLKKAWNAQSDTFKTHPPIRFRWSPETQTISVYEALPNWQKGIPLSNYLNSIKRHTDGLMVGDGSEDHVGAVGWNAACYQWTLTQIQKGLLPAHLDDRLYLKS